MVLALLLAMSAGNRSVPVTQVTAYFASREMAESAAERLRQRGLLAAADIEATEERLPPAYGVLARFMAAGAVIGAVIGAAGGAFVATSIAGNIEALRVSLVAGGLLGSLGFLAGYAVAEPRIAMRNEKMGSRMTSRLISSTESSKRVKRLLRDLGAHRINFQH